MVSDRIFGAVVAVVALAYIASANQIQTSFLADPVGPKMFPMMIGAGAFIAGIFVILRPDGDPDWPVLSTIGALLIAVVVLVAYAYALKPFGFILPTAVASTILSYQIFPKIGQAVLVGAGLSIGLFMLFKFALGLGLVAFPSALFG